MNYQFVFRLHYFGCSTSFTWNRYFPLKSCCKFSGIKVYAVLEEYVVLFLFTYRKIQIQTLIVVHLGLLKQAYRLRISHGMGLYIYTVIGVLIHVNHKVIAKY